MEETKHTVRDATHPLQFTGILLAHESTETDSALRWTELELYKVTKGKYENWYFLHRIGQSVVYHLPNACGYGTATSWDKVPLDAERCPVCKPVAPSDSDGEKQYEVWLESPRHNVDRCATPEKVEDALLMKRTGRDGTRFLSTPARNLLAKSARVDDGIRSLFERVEYL